MKENIKKLFIDKEYVISEIAREANGFLRIDKKSCIPILPFSFGKLTIIERILLELGTAYLCFVSDFVATGAITRKNLQQRCKVSPAALRARLSDLRKDQFIESSDEGEEITTSGLIEFRDLLRRLRLEESSTKE